MRADLDKARVLAVVTNKEKHRARVEALIRRAVGTGAKGVYDICVVVSQLEYMRGYTLALRPRKQTGRICSHCGADTSAPLKSAKG